MPRRCIVGQGGEQGEMLAEHSEQPVPNSRQSVTRSANSTVPSQLATRGRPSDAEEAASAPRLGGGTGGRPPRYRPIASNREQLAQQRRRPPRTTKPRLKAGGSPSSSSSSPSCAGGRAREWRLQLTGPAAGPSYSLSGRTALSSQRSFVGGRMRSKGMVGGGLFQGRLVTVRHQAPTRG